MKIKQHSLLALLLATASFSYADVDRPSQLTINFTNNAHEPVRLCQASQNHIESGSIKISGDCQSTEDNNDRHSILVEAKKDGENDAPVCTITAVGNGKNTDTKLTYHVDSFAERCDDYTDHLGKFKANIQRSNDNKYCSNNKKYKYRWNMNSLNNVEADPKSGGWGDCDSGGNAGPASDFTTTVSYTPPNPDTNEAQ